MKFMQIFTLSEGFETMKELHLDWACLNILSRMTWRRNLLLLLLCVRSNVSMKGKNLKVNENMCIDEIQGQSTLQPNSY